MRKKTTSSGVYMATYHNGCYLHYSHLERNNDKFMKFHINRFPYFEISATPKNFNAKYWGGGGGGLLD